MASPSAHDSFDIFISYSRADNRTGAITRFVECLTGQVELSLKRPLRSFFDLHAIEGMDDWEHRILFGLRQSRVFVACVSPSFLSSSYCEWEFAEYVRMEAAQVLSGQGIAPVYVLDVPAWAESSAQQASPAWVSELRRRQFFDCRHWFQDSDPTSAKSNDPAIAKLALRIGERIIAAERAEQSPGNVDAHNLLFTGRKRELQNIRETLLRPTALPAAAVIHGVGGMGKTALAIEYAHSFAHEYGGGRWQIDCAGLTTLSQALAALAPAMGIEFRDTRVDDSSRAERVLGELRRRAALNAPNACLLLLDNLVEKGILAPASTQRLPSASWLHLLITTQLGPQEVSDLDPKIFIPLDELTDEEGLALIERYQPDGRLADPSEREAAREISKLLGGFPLAIETAAVVLAQPFGPSGRAFLRLLDSEGLRELEQSAVGASRGVRHREKRLTVTVKPVLDALEPEEQCALGYASLMPPDCIVWEWLESLTGDEFDELENAAPSGAMDRWALVRSRLTSLRLVVVRGEMWAGRMHPLVQEVIRLRNDTGTNSNLRRVVQHALRLCTSLERDWETRDGDWEIEALRRWSVHLMSIDERGGGLIESKTADLLDRLGRYPETEDLRRHVLAVRERLLGPEDLDTLSAANSLAGAMLKLGGYAEAESLYRRTLEAHERLCGVYDVRTLMSVAGLGLSLFHLGEYKEAEPCLKRALAASERVLGEEHPSTLTSVNNLALLYERQGRYAEAEPLYQRTLAARERVLGEKHPDTLVSVDNLAGLHESQGRYAEAEPLYRRALTALERVLGEEHPSTLVSVNNLAGLYATQGRYSEAEPLYQRALAARERVLGKDHPSTLVSVNNLAGLYESQGRHAEAEPLSKRALGARERVLGKDHPSTLASVNTLATLYANQGRYAEAEPLYQQALAVCERVLGEEHPETLVSVNNLAGLYKSQGRYAEAEPLYQRALAARERVLGKEHPHTLMSASDLAALFAIQGRYAGAERLYQRTLAARERVLGEEHPDTLISVNNLAVLYETQGRYAEAEPLLQRALDARERAHGEQQDDSIPSS
jgi:tetratricopeptide (TPR) repeat protein